MGYHKAKIERGVIGEISKIREEFAELDDAYLQGNRVLEICEMCDLIGAIDLYAQNHFNLRAEDLLMMARKTEEAFKEGKR